jgi:ATP-dependent exoDNAse (exonuclease V) beta subunit
MHKAKGLEFDHIIVPGLAKLTRSDNNPLLEWHERINSRGQARLFMAALTETGEEEDKLYSLLRHEKQYKSYLENTRLLYIAITRAKKSAKLFAAVGVNKKQELQIPSSSLLSRIWREIQSEAHKGINSLQVHSAELLASKCNSKDNPTRLGVPLPTLITRFTNSPAFEPKERLQLRQQLPNAETDLTLTQESSQKEGILNAAIGSLIHSVLEDYSNSKDKEIFLSNLDSQKAYWKLLLRNKVTSKLELTESLSFIERTLEKLLHDNGLKWIFSHDYTECHSEYPITSISQGKIHEHIIDRTLVDNNGVRWIIDYKTGIPVNEEEADFIIKQKIAHESQLYRYRSLFAELENRKTKTAILFTSIQKLIEV